MPLWPDDVVPEFPGVAPQVEVIDTVAQKRLEERRLARQRALTSILFMVVGALVLSVSAGFLWGVPAAGVVFGALSFVVGVVLGLSG
jgi:hypothetical protein